jgi:hypothetical protein
MISGSLWEALGKMEWYQETTPSVYDDITDEIEPVKWLMRELQLELDTPPSQQAPVETTGP